MRRQTTLRTMTIMMTLVITLIMLSTLALSFGVAPSRYSFDYDEDVDSFSLRVINSQREDLMLSVSVQGPLSEYIDLQQDTIRVAPSESQKTIYYDLDVPEDLPPGITESAIVIKDMGSSSSQSQGSLVTASVSVKQKIEIFSPYPDRYIDGDLFTQADTLQQPVRFSAHLKNKGSASTDVSGSIIIKTPSNAQVGRISIPETELASLSAKKVRVSYDGLENPGTYIAEAHINYGGKSITLTDEFMVGNKEVEATTIDPGEFNLGEIVKLDVSLDNKWNQKIEDVSAEVEVLKQDGTVIETTETTRTDIKAYDSQVLPAYWDTEGVDPGTYDLGVRVSYEDIVSEYYFNAVIGADSIEVTSDEVTGKATGGDSGEGPDIYTIVVLLIIAIIVINVSWFVLIKKKILKK